MRGQTLGLKRDVPNSNGVFAASTLGFRRHWYCRIRRADGADQPWCGWSNGEWLVSSHFPSFRQYVCDLTPTRQFLESPRRRQRRRHPHSLLHALHLDRHDGTDTGDVRHRRPGAGRQHRGSSRSEQHRQCRRHGRCARRRRRVHRPVSTADRLDQVCAHAADPADQDHGQELHAAAPDERVQARHYLVAGREYSHYGH